MEFFRYVAERETSRQIAGQDKRIPSTAIALLRRSQ
jgi:hypothetical protein